MVSDAPTSSGAVIGERQRRGGDQGCHKTDQWLVMTPPPLVLVTFSGPEEETLGPGTFQVVQGVVPENILSHGYPSPLSRHSSPTG